MKKLTPLLLAAMVGADAFPSSPSVGSAAPALNLADPAGVTHSSEGLEEGTSLVLVFFRGTW